MKEFTREDHVNFAAFAYRMGWHHPDEPERIYKKGSSSERAWQHGRSARLMGESYDLRTAQRWAEKVVDGK